MRGNMHVSQEFDGSADTIRHRADTTKVYVLVLIPGMIFIRGKGERMNVWLLSFVHW